MINKYVVFVIICFAVFLSCQESKDVNAEVDKPNILFIAIDDLRPELGIYGNKIIKTPNIDQLGNEGIVFEHAYVQQAACNPSRTSLMTGLRPDSTKVWDLWTHFRDSIPDVVTLPQYFAQHGYSTSAIGKIYHNIFPDSSSWTQPKIYLRQFPFDPDAFYVTNENLDIQKQRIQEALQKENGRMKKDPFGHYYVKANATEIVDGPDSLYYDGAQNIAAIEQLEKLANQKKPFFFAVGYYRPHLPFNAPKKYWDLYDPNDISTAENTFIPKNVPSFSVNALIELRGYTDFKNSPPPLEGSLDESQARHLKHGYYASVSYIDKLLGDLIEKLKSLNLYDNTIIVLWGDHGYKLGEHNSWTKFTNFKIDAHAPLIIKSHQTNQNHQRIEPFTEFVDIYPTLCEMAGLSIPPHLQGISQYSLMTKSTTIGKEAVFFQFLKESRWAIPPGNEQMGYSVLTSDYHYIYWIDWKTKKYTADELFDLKNDPNENENISIYPENQYLVERYRQMLAAGWKSEKERIETNRVTEGPE